MTPTHEAPYSDEEMELLAAERDRPGPSAEMKALVRARLASTTPGDGGSTPSSSAPSGTPGLADRAGLLGSAGRIAAIAFAVGGALGGGAVYAVMMSSRAPEPVVEARQTEAVPAALSAPLEPSLGADAKALPGPPATSSPSASREVSPSPALRAAPSPSASQAIEDPGGVLGERRLVERARSALARGDYDACLAAADAHGAQYREGALAEEREALAVQALARAGRTREAAERGGRFRKSYPESLLRGVVDAALASPKAASDR